MFNFNNQIVLVTGAAGNLGFAVAQAFRTAGAGLILVDRARERLSELYADWLPADDIWLATADLTNEASVADMAATVLAEAGRVDVLVNVAGGFSMGAAVHETELATWEFLLNLNAKSILLTSKAFVPQMIARGEGKIVSVAARAGLEGKAKMGAYTVSKAAVIRLTESLADELKEHGINVNCILPGTIDTPQNRAAMPNANVAKWVAPAELANVILFLASPAASAVQGAAVPVYGQS
jgi:NAD(P)-dependent dehydrogenase (short-subunit alcohol dehydrogenase family)